MRDFTRGEDYVNDPFGAIDPITGKIAQRMDAGIVVPTASRGFRTMWALFNFTVVQEVEIGGATLIDTNVRHQVSVQHTATERKDKTTF